MFLLLRANSWFKKKKKDVSLIPGSCFNKPLYSCDTERFIFCKLCFITFVCLNECCFNGVSLRSVYVTRVWLGPGPGKRMNDHFTTHLLWAVSSGDWISNESIFCHESHHSYLMCNKEQSQRYLCLPLFFFLWLAVISEILLSAQPHYHRRARCGKGVCSFFQETLLPIVPSREHCGIAVRSPQNCEEFSRRRHTETKSRSTKIMFFSTNRKLVLSELISKTFNFMHSQRKFIMLIFRIFVINN